MSAVSWAEALHDPSGDDGVPDPLLPLRLMSAIYLASPSPIIANDVHGNVLFWNSAATRVFGYTAGEAMRLRIPFLSVPQDQERVRDVHRRVFRGETITGIELCTTTKAGARVDVLLSAAPLPAADGTVRGMVATLEDITARKQAERAQADSERRYRQLFEQIADAIVVHRQGRILVANSVCYRMLGVPYDGTLVGRSIFEFLHPEDHALALERASTLLRGASVESVAQYRIARPDGTVFPIEVRSQRLLWDGEPAIQFVAHDLTERVKQAERLRAAEDQMRHAQKMEAVGRLAGGIAHDFNNVLTAIGGFSSLLRDEIPAANPMYEYVHEIQRGVERATSLTRQLLTFSKRQVAQPRVLDLNHVVSDLQPMLQRLIREDIQLDVLLDGSGAVVKADLSHMEQVILNLAVNSRDAMPDGGRLTLETRVVDVDEEYASQHLDILPGRYVMLAVTDTGVGMSAEVRERVFEPFYTTKSNGTGLGLATVYGIVKQSGGAIWIYSEPGRGTRIKIYLPAEDGPVPQPAARPVGETQVRAATVLLVEDDVSVRRLTQRILQRAGLTVLCAVDGPSALDLARQHAGCIDIVLSDVVMPEMQGPELVGTLRREYPSLRAIFMSGYAEDTLARRGDIGEDTPVIEKPFSAPALIAAIDSVLRPA